MELALGVLQWTPSQFWDATFYEVSCAYIGYARANGVGPWAVGPHGWSEVQAIEHLEDVEALKKLVDDDPKFRPKKGRRKWQTKPSIN
jgi:hypothetical protein